MKKRITICIWLWLCLSTSGVFSAPNDEIEDFLDNQVEVLNTILGGSKSLALPDNPNKDIDFQQNSSKISNSDVKKNAAKQKFENLERQKNQNSAVKKGVQGNKETQNSNELDLPHSARTIVDIFDKTKKQKKNYFGSIRGPNKQSNSLYKEITSNRFVNREADLFNPSFENQLKINGEVGKTEAFGFSQNPFLMANQEKNVQLAYHEGIITDSQQLKLLANNLFSEETLEDLAFAKQEIQSFLNQANSWIKEVIFDDSNWRLEDAIYGSTAFMFIHDSSVMQFLRKLDGGTENLSQIADKYNIENGTDETTDESLADDSVLVSGYYSILDFWEKHARTIFITLLLIIIIKEIFSITSNVLNSKNKRKGRQRQSSKNSSNRRRRQKQISVQPSPDPVYATISSDVAIETEKITRSRRKHSSRRHYSSRRRRPKRSFVRKILDDLFASSTHKK